MKWMLVLVSLTGGPETPLETYDSQEACYTHGAAAVFPGEPLRAVCIPEVGDTYRRIQTYKQENGREFAAAP